MLQLQKTMTALTAAGSLAWFAGCEQPAAPPAAAPGGTASATHEEDGHDHGPGEHQHGPGHAHAAGPHGGTVADWGGGKYHVEFTVSHPDKQATVYILGDDEKTPSPISAKEIQLVIAQPAIDILLAAQPQEGDPADKSSRFVGTHDNLGIVQEYAGTLSGEIDGTPYTGDFKEEPHGH